MKHSCYLCEHDTPVDIPQDLVEAAANGEVVIFAGAGISTEVPAVFPVSMFREVAHEVGIAADASFPAVMQEYEARKGRPELVRSIWKRFEYAESFPTLYKNATRFHRELATMPYLSEIVTTNWDRYFEQECGAIPIVSDVDYALHELRNRKVYKIHGSIDSLSSIVATSDDYEAALNSLRGNAIGGTLRHLLATKRVNFVGYSLSDSDFIEIYNALTVGMSKMRPRGYAVSPFPPSNASKFDLTVLQTGGDHFLRQLKEAVSNRQDCFLPDEIYDRVESIEEEVAREHDTLAEKVTHAKHPGVIYCLSYQDGLLDAFSRILSRRKTGEYSDSHHVQGLVRSYDAMLKKAIGEENYWDASYIEGYLNGIFSLLADEEDLESFPLFFCFTRKDLITVDEAMSAFKSLHKRRPKVWEAASTAAAKISPDMIVQHTPFL